MRIAAIELHVEVSKRRRTAADLSDADAVTAALRAHPDERNALALGAIEVAAAFEPAVIVCPGWTFVRRAPRPATLTRAAGNSAVLYEVLADADARPHVLEAGVARELPSQAFSTSGELDDARHDGAARLAAALKDGRRITAGLVLLSAEVNAVRRTVQPGTKVSYAWDKRVASAGLVERDLSDALVLNPSHTPAGSYVRDKRRAGPWRALVSTANTLDRARLGRTPLAPPAHAVLAGRDVEPSEQPVAVDERGSRVIVYDLTGA
jgi:hypothetical protein